MYQNFKENLKAILNRRGKIKVLSFFLLFIFFLYIILISVFNLFLNKGISENDIINITPVYLEDLNNRISNAGFPGVKIDYNDVKFVDNVRDMGLLNITDETYYNYEGKGNGLSRREERILFYKGMVEWK